ncbi:hypothetical protein RvY_17176-2 [Ramazzottius varieornatus]|uniref:Uncharacterized protein n=1 Tax=Ramazzottius varieornatus TaxID=947166 RepID=A0A1D1W185_RAMVA|nr:hypothetical protein RvY_17176-2 [Ramazzottius varieornatus]
MGVYRHCNTTRTNQKFLVLLVINQDSSTHAWTVNEKADGPDGCRLTVGSTGHDARKILPASCSAFASTHIGLYILYGTTPPHRGIAAHSLQCRNTQPISEEMLFVPTSSFVKKIMVSEKGPDQQRASLIIMLHVDGYPSALQIQTTRERFRILPCSFTFPLVHVTDVAVIDHQKATLVVFARDNPDRAAPTKYQYAPMYHSPHADRNSTPCGYVPVEHTVKVDLWLQDGTINAVFVQQVANTHRSFLRFFTIRMTGKKCTAVRWRQQAVMGATPWETGLPIDPQVIYPSNLFPFTVDNILCGVQDIKIIKVGESVTLIVAVSNTQSCLENSCSAEDHLTFEQANPHRCVSFCGCPYAISTSFVMLYNRESKKFDLDVEKPLSFRTFKKGPDLATDIETIVLSCCTLIQLCSSTGACELYSLHIDQPAHALTLTHLADARLPSMTQGSAVKLCPEGRAVISYTDFDYEQNNRANIFTMSCWQKRELQESEGRFHLALSNGSGSYIPVSESLPASRPVGAVQRSLFYVTNTDRPPFANPFSRPFRDVEKQNAYNRSSFPHRLKDN